jgi:hypothetical protein
MEAIMENKNQTKPAESDMVQIKAINEDKYWSKEYGIPEESLRDQTYDTTIYDLIVDTHIKTQKSGN